MPRSPRATRKPSQFSGANQAKSVLNDWFAGRAHSREQFLKKCAWDHGACQPIGADMGARRYFRVTRNDETRVLMESVPDGHEYATPGQRLDDYVLISEILRGCGLAAPHVYEQDLKNGYLLIEDFGDTSFRAAMMSGQASQDEVYSLALRVVSRLQDFNWPPGVPRPNYYEGAMYKGLRRMVDWYVPVKRGQPNDPDLVEKFLATWKTVEESAVVAVGPAIQGFVHCDFHLENLQWRADKHGLERAGILDFQDARQGPAVYDLTNLLNDARVALDPAYKRARLAEFLTDFKTTEQDNFERWFWILSGQFLHRVAGQFVKHAIIGNTSYLERFMPSIQANLKDIMNEPALAPINKFMRDLGVDLEPFPENADYASWADLIAADAY